MDLATSPGQIFVVATFLPLASFLLLFLFFALRSALRSSPEGSTGASLFELLGGERPGPWPAYVATAAIAVAFVCSATGAAWYLAEDHHSAHVGSHEEETPEEETPPPSPWAGKMVWLSLTPLGTPDAGRGTTLEIGYKIDSLNAIMFVMVTFIALLIHLFSIGYMADERQVTVEDHQVHGATGALQRRGRFNRFFLFLSLFCFSMLNLILADNLFQVFVSWELVGICSYLLIGFYYERPSASNAANKAFITNRIGDAGFLIGLMILWTYCGTFNFEQLFGQVRAPVADAHGDALTLAGKVVRGDIHTTPKGRQELTIDAQGSAVLLFPREPHLHADALEPGSTMPVRTEPKPRQFSHMPYWVLVVAGLGIFLGCVGKSAQFPLQVWLPDAMEGPTPVSALIHAATMVAAGVYLVGRCFPLFTPEAQLVIAYIGAITLFAAATIALVMTDIKKVLAYSTVSQLGFMMLALGLGGWVAGLFHLITHACFKALLFLGSGSVIHGCRHEQDMMRMGGLRAKMRITALTMLMGVLAIAGIPGFSGWYSKDAILAQALGYVVVHPVHLLLFALPLATAGLTAFYMFRLWFLTFSGTPRDHHVHEHAHESPPLMTFPLIVLALLSIGVAWGWPFFSTHFPFLNAEASWLEGQLHHSQPASIAADFGALAGDGGPWAGKSDLESSPRYWAVRYHEIAGNLALAMAGLGFLFAYAVYYLRAVDLAEGATAFAGLQRFLQNKWGFDSLYRVILVDPSLRLAHLCRRLDLGVIDWLLDRSAALTVQLARWDGRVDSRVVDGLVNAIARGFQALGRHLPRWQTGAVRTYVLYLVLGTAGIFVLLAYVAAVIHN